MSVPVAPRRLMPADIARRKGGEPVIALTAYQTNLAAIADRHADLLLVGDSLGMVLYGMDSTLPVTLDMMILHGQAVMRGSSKALVVVDMPFGSYEESPALAFRNCARVMKETGCGAVKLEGGQRMAETIRYLTARGIPVLAHVGLTPQAVNILGGYKVQGRDMEQAMELMADAQAVAEAGAFAIVLEAIAEPVAAQITTSITLPTIGIGASASCDGQILVMDDMLGFSPRLPKFAKAYAQGATMADEAIRLYAAEVRARQFPGTGHVYSAASS